jgi:hypothetical protein
VPDLTILPVFQECEPAGSEVAAMEDRPSTPVKASRAASESPSPFSPVNTNTRRAREDSIIVIDDGDDDIPSKPVRRVLCAG